MSDLEEVDETITDLEVAETQRWNKRTKQLTLSLDRAFVESHDVAVTFISLSVKRTRKQAAARFYSLLVMAKTQSVKVSQVDAQSDILIEKGPTYGGVAVV